MLVFGVLLIILSCGTVFGTGNLNWNLPNDRTESQNVLSEDGGGGGGGGGGGVSLVFVFDATGSMGDDIKGAQEGATEILYAMLQRPDKPIHNFILIQFRDPEIRLLANTRDHVLFKQMLDGIEVGYGGDCPEMSMGAVRLGLELGRSKSYVYVFTDATAKDYLLVNDVIQLVQVKLSKVTFVITGDCGNTNQDDYLAYKKVAFSSSGQVYNVKKHDVNEVLNVLKSSILQKGEKVNLLTFDSDVKGKGQKNSLFLPVDKSLSEFTVSISGKRAKVTLINPFNTSALHNKLLKVLDLDNVKVVNVKNPESGVWTIQVKSDSQYTVRSSGISNSDFSYGFSSRPTIYKNDTSLRPVKGASTNILIWPTEPRNIESLNEIDIVGINGKVFKALQLKPVKRQDSLYTTDTFTTPNELFYITVHGVNRDGSPFKRITPSAVESVIPEVAVVVIEAVKEFIALQPASLCCQVKSLLPFNVQWLKNNEKIGETQHYMQSADVKFDFGKILLADAGVYLCRVKNSVGYSQKHVKVIVKELPPVIERGKDNVNKNRGDQVELECKAVGEPKPTITWYFGDHEIPRDKIADDGTLILKNLTLNNGGTYSCFAKNIAGSAKSSTSITVIDPPRVTLVPSYLKVVEGQIAELRCTSTGVPLPTKNWWKDGYPLKDHQESSDGEMRFRVHRNDSGIYACGASNSGGTDVKFSTLSVIVPPKIVNDGEQNIQVIEGKDVYLKCKAEGIPAPTISWNRIEKPRNVLLFNGENYRIVDSGIFIMKTSTKLAGAYICKAENLAGVSNITYNIEVLVIPHIMDEPLSFVNLTIGDDYKIPCKVSGHPEPSVSWYKDNKLLKTDTQGKVQIIAVSTLFLRDVILESSGTYSCVASNIAGKFSRDHIIRVNAVPPVIYNESSNVSAILGDRVELQCQVTGNPKPTITWHFGNNQLFRKQISTNGSLIIDKVTLNEEGSYTCFAENIGGSDKSKTFLTVIVKPWIQRDSTFIIAVTIGNDYTFPCKASGHPKPSISWYKGNTVLQSDNNANIRIAEDNSLILHNVTLERRGIYSCIAKNIGGKDSINYTFHVQAIKPVIQRGLANVKGIVGKQVKLECRASGNPKPKIKWHFRNNVLTGKQISTNGALILENVNLSDEGLYTCVAENIGGSDTTATSLVVLVPPKVTLSPTTFSAIEGQIIELICKASGKPLPSLKWMKENLTEFPASVGEKLRFAVQNNDSGNYSCHGLNPAGSDVKNASVTVVVPPTIIGDANQTIQVIEGHDLYLQCNAEGSPTPIISWNKLKEQESIQLDDGKSYRVNRYGLPIKNTSTESSGIYICTAKNAGGLAEKNFVVDVLVKPRFLDEYPSFINLTVGDDYVLPCKVSGHPQPSILWYKGSHILQTDTNDNIKIINNTLIIFEASLGISGKYSCVAYNAAGKSSRNHTFYIQDSSVSQSTKRIELAEMDSGSIICPVSSADSITWQKNGLPLKTERGDSTHFEFVDDGSHLIINDAEGTDRGVYTCIAHTNDRILNFNTTLDVISSPEFYLSSVETDISVKEGESVTFDCSLIGTSQPKVNWRNLTIDEDIRLRTSGIPVSPDKSTAVVLDNSNQILKIKSAKSYHSGKYKCVGSNSMFETYKFFTLTVNGVPEVEGFSEEKVEIVLGQSHELVCSIKGVPVPTFSWTFDDLRNSGRKYLNGTSIDIKNPPYYYDILRVENVAMTNNGSYTCTATNQAGSRTKQFHVMVLVPPKIDKLGIAEEIKIKSVEDLHLSCTIKGIPAPSVDWLRNGVIVQRQVGKEVTNNKYSINLVAISGNYSCRASNKAGITEKKFHVMVY